MNGRMPDFGRTFADTDLKEIFIVNSNIFQLSIQPDQQENDEAPLCTYNHLLYRQAICIIDCRFSIGIHGKHVDSHQSLYYKGSG